MEGTETIYTVLCLIYEGKLCGMYLMPLPSRPGIWLIIYENEYLMSSNLEFTSKGLKFTYEQLQQFYSYLENNYNIKPPFREARSKTNDDVLQEIMDSALIK